MKNYNYSNYLNIFIGIKKLLFKTYQIDNTTYSLLSALACIKIDIWSLYHDICILSDFKFMNGIGFILKLYFQKIYIRYYKNMHV